MDDFGIGYSSLTHLERFLIDMLKLDRSFVATLRASRQSAVVAGVAHVASAMKLEALIGIEAGRS